MNNKNMVITLCITFALFSFVIFLVYLVYCFSYYDSYQESIYANKFNDREYGYVFKNMENDNLTLDDFMIPINNMYDKSYLVKIYDNYYDGKLKIDKEEFIENYYFGNRTIEKENIIFQEDGKTSLIRRRKLKYTNIDVVNKKGISSRIGIVKNINFVIEDKSTLVLDNKEIVCNDNNCLVTSLFGGIHTLNYYSNGYRYFAVVNIKNDSQHIYVGGLDSLVKVA